MGKVPSEVVVSRLASVSYQYADANHSKQNGIVNVNTPLPPILQTSHSVEIPSRRRNVEEEVQEISLKISDTDDETYANGSTKRLDGVDGADCFIKLNSGLSRFELSDCDSESTSVAQHPQSSPESDVRTDLNAGAKRPRSSFDREVG